MAGAGSAHWMMIRLPHQVKTLFLDWLRTHFPDRSARIEGLVRQLHGGRLYDSRFGVRHRGRGPVADQIEATFKVFARRYGLSRPLKRPSSSAFRRPADEALRRLEEAGARIIRVWNQGATLIETNGATYAVTVHTEESDGDSETNAVQ